MFRTSRNGFPFFSFFYWTFLVKEMYYHLFNHMLYYKNSSLGKWLFVLNHPISETFKLLDVVNTNWTFSNNVNFFLRNSGWIESKLPSYFPLISISETFKLLDVVSGGKKEGACLWRGEEGPASPSLHAGAIDCGGHDTFVSYQRAGMSYICLHC